MHNFNIKLKRSLASFGKCESFGFCCALVEGVF